MPGNVPVLGILENAPPYKKWRQIRRQITPDYHALILCVYQYQLMRAWGGGGALGYGVLLCMFDSGAAVVCQVDFVCMLLCVSGG
jgi:hypothetical protein